jgi:aryl-alcohol dehydrogenase-like predicted oxidoreductase
MASTPSAIPLTAASNEAQLDENLGALSVELTDEQMTTLTTASDSLDTTDVAG